VSGVGTTGDLGWALFREGSALANCQFSDRDPAPPTSTAPHTRCSAPVLQ